ncbi:MAG: hypothetical protein ACLR3C_16670 [Eggerthella lenta]
MLPIAVLWAAIMILMACGFVRIARKLRRLSASAPCAVTTP